MENGQVHPSLKNMRYDARKPAYFLYVPLALKHAFPQQVPAAGLRPGSAGFVLGFFYRQSDLEQDIDAMKQAIMPDGLCWIAFPKGGQLQTDLSHDILRQDLARHGLDVVSPVSVDDTWSAVRVRPVS